MLAKQKLELQLRHMRKQRFGGYLVEKRRRGEPKDGLWEYRLVLGRSNDRDKTERAVPVQFRMEDMKHCLEILRIIYPKLKPEWQAPITKLGQWLATHVQEEEGDS